MRPGDLLAQARRRDDLTAKATRVAADAVAQDQRAHHTGEQQSVTAERFVRRALGVDVLTAAEARIAQVFDAFPRVCVSFSGGKDSTTLLHLTMAEARRRQRRVGVLLIDLEAQYTQTIAHALACVEMYRDLIDLHWVCLPLALRNAVSQFEPHWQCWDPERRRDWIRQPPPCAIVDEAYFPFFVRGMEFEEFVPAFNAWYGQGELTACLIGIRAQESLNRVRTMFARKLTWRGVRWTTAVGPHVYNAYPIYDWRTEDIWTYAARTGTPQNPLYDRMHRAGVPLSQQRICQPYGDDQRRGLWLYQIIEPDTWGKVVARVNGANSGATYSRTTGNMLGIGRIAKPDGHTWESFSRLLLDTMPPALREHYENKIAVFLHWWAARGVDPIPDEAPPRLESGVDGERRPSWRRIAKVLLRHDYWCKGLSFSQTDSKAYERYRALMRKRRKAWGR